MSFVKVSASSNLERRFSLMSRHTSATLYNIARWFTSLKSKLKSEMHAPVMFHYIHEEEDTCMSCVI